MGITEKKYLIDMQENKDFLKDMRNDMFRFGHTFPSEGGGSYLLCTVWPGKSDLYHAIQETLNSIS